MSKCKRYFSSQPTAAWEFFEYDPERQTLTLHWKDRAPEIRPDVTASTYQRLTEARSKLSFIRRWIGTELPCVAGRFRNEASDGQ